MSLAATVEAMAAAGCSIEQIVAVVRRHEQEVEVKATERRAKDAERKRRARVRDVTRTDADSNGNCVTDADAADAVSSSFPPSSSPPITPLITTPNSPPSTHSRATLADFRAGIAGLYTEHRCLPPETGRAGIWLAQGYDPDICLAVIRSILPGKPGVKLAYFDGPIADAHAPPKGEARKTGPPSGFRNPFVAAAADLARSAQHERPGSIEILPAGTAAR